jgi:hypothetical protein
MLPSRFALVALLFASPLCADTLSPEFPASITHLQPGDVNTASDVAVGATRRYEAVQDGGQIFGNDITADGRADLSTRRLLGPGRLLDTAAVGDDFFVLSDTADRLTLTVRRANDGKSVQLPIITSGFRGMVLSDGTRLWLLYNRFPAVFGIALDVNLNVVVPEFQITARGSVVEGQGAAARGMLIVLLSAEPEQVSNPRYWTVDANGKSKIVATTTPIDAFVSNGTDFLGVYNAKFPVPTIWTQRYSTAGTPSGELIALATGDATRTFDSPTAASNGVDYFVSWREVANGTDTVLYAQRLGSATSTLLASGKSLSPAVLAGGDAGVLASWSDAAGNAFMRRADADDVPDPKFFVRAQQELPSIASDGVTAMAAWREKDLRVGRVARDGTPLDGPGFIVSSSRPLIAPQILFNGSRYTVFWIADNALMARHVERDGRMAGDAIRVTPLSQAPTQFSAVWDGNRYLLVWRDNFDSHTPYTASMDVSGAVTASPMPTHLNQILLGLGPRHVLIGTDFQELRAQFLDTGARFTIAATTWSIHDFHLASNGVDYVLTWTQSAWSTATQRVDNEIWAVRFDTNGQSIGRPIVLGAITSPVVEARLSNDGVRGEAIPLFDGKRYRIVLAADTLAELVLNDDAFICACFERADVPFDAFQIKKLSAAITAEGSVLVYDRADTPPSNARNVFVRFARVPPPARRRATK